MPTSSQSSAPRLGDCVTVVDVQDYEITWNEWEDMYIGETGVLLAVDQAGVDSNKAGDNRHSAPYQVRLDNGETIHVAAIEATQGGAA